MSLTKGYNAMEISMWEKPLYPVTSAGIDYVTASNADEFHVVMCGQYMIGMLTELKERGFHVTKSARLGYIGRATDGFFHGYNEGKTLAVLSGDLAREFGAGLIRCSQKQSRIDLQVTVDAGAERPVLSRSAYRVATQMKQRGGRPREFKLTVTHPQGDTLNVNKRTSDSYGRLYDWGAAHKTGEKHRYWRYEVEAKRNYATHLATYFGHHHADKAVATRVVFDWFKATLFEPAFEPLGVSCTHERTPATDRPGVLSWFNSSVSITIEKAIAEFGPQRVSDELRLERWFDLKPERR